MASLQYIFIAVVIFTVLTKSDACDGYNFTLYTLESCVEDNSAKLTGVKIEMSKECILKVNGCLELLTVLDKCKVSYDVRRTGLAIPVKGKRSLCDELKKYYTKDPLMKSFMEANGLSTECPIQPFELCTDSFFEEMDVSQFKNKFRLGAGRYSGMLKFECEIGSICFNFDAEFSKRK